MGRDLWLRNGPGAFLRRMSDMDQPGSLSAWFRRRRLEQFEAFARTLPTQGRPRVLDVGGTVRFWENLGALDRYQVTVANVGDQIDRGEDRAGVHRIIADGTRLPIADKSFDIAFSNSVIEHVGDRAQQRRFLDELQRVAGAVYLQTPCRWFPIEPHFHFPFFALLPLEIRAWLLSHLALGHGGRMPDRAAGREMALTARLLRRRDLRAFAPDLTLGYERFLAWPKSHLLWGRC
jgi:SAM-dependent methyltransferase